MGTRETPAAPSPACLGGGSVRVQHTPPRVSGRVRVCEQGEPGAAAWERGRPLPAGPGQARGAGGGGPAEAAWAPSALVKQLCAGLGPKLPAGQGTEPGGTGEEQPHTPRLSPTPRAQRGCVQQGCVPHRDVCAPWGCVCDPGDKAVGWLSTFTGHGDSSVSPLGTPPTRWRQLGWLRDAMGPAYRGDLGWCWQSWGQAGQGTLRDSLCPWHEHLVAACPPFPHRPQGGFYSPWHPWPMPRGHGAYSSVKGRV